MKRRRGGKGKSRLAPSADAEQPQARARRIARRAQQAAHLRTEGDVAVLHVGLVVGLDLVDHVEVVYHQAAGLHHAVVREVAQPDEALQPPKYEERPVREDGVRNGRSRWW